MFIPNWSQLIPIDHWDQQPFGLSTAKHWLLQNHSPVAVTGDLLSLHPHLGTAYGTQNWGHQAGRLRIIQRVQVEDVPMTQEDRLIAPLVSNRNHQNISNWQIHMLMLLLLFKLLLLLSQSCCSSNNMLNDVVAAIVVVQLSLIRKKTFKETTWDASNPASSVQRSKWRVLLFAATVIFYHHLKPSLWKFSHVEVNAPEPLLEHVQVISIYCL